MNDKPLHNKHTKEPLPTPGVPVDDAWQQMHQLLVQHHLTTKPNKDKRRWLLWFCLLLIISIGSIITYLSFNNHPALISKHKKIAGKQNIHSNNANKTSLPAIQKSKQSLSQNALANNNNNNKKQKGFALYNSNKKFFTDADQPVNPALNTDDNATIKTTNNKQPNTISLFPSPDSNMAKQDEKISSSFPITDSIAGNTKSEIPVNKKNKNETKQSRIKPEVGLQWNIDFSLTNNSHYFSSFDSKAHQYYMLLLPSLKAGIHINNRQSISLIINPYKQQFAGNKIVHIEKPWIASVEPDIVTLLIKNRGINFGLQYNHSVTKKLSVNIGGSYMFLQNVLLLEQSVESTSGMIISQKIYDAHKKDEAFHYLKRSFLNGDASLQYNFKKFSIGAGITVPLNNISSDRQYTVQPLNGELLLHYHFK